jgi:hypothetical protein
MAYGTPAAYPALNRRCYWRQNGKMRPKSGRGNTTTRSLPAQIQKEDSKMKTPANQVPSQSINTSQEEKSMRRHLPNFNVVAGFICLALVLGLASTAFADYLVSDFETGTAEGWTNAMGLTGGYRSGYPMYMTDGTVVGTLTAGTTGSGQQIDGQDDWYSLKVSCPETWWDESAAIDLAQLDGGVDAFFANCCVQVTVTFLASEWGIDSSAWSRPGLTLIVCGNSSSPQYDADPAYPGRAWTSPCWVTSCWLPCNGDMTMSFYLPYDDATKAQFATDATCLGLILCPHWTESGGTGTAGGNYYIDSVSLCPEPGEEWWCPDCPPPSLTPDEQDKTKIELQKDKEALEAFLAKVDKAVNDLTDAINKETDAKKKAILEAELAKLLDFGVQIQDKIAAVQAAVDAITTITKTAIQTLLGTIPDLFKALEEIISGLPKIVQSALQAAIDTTKAVIQGSIGILKEFINGIGDLLKSLWSIPKSIFGWLGLCSATDLSSDGVHQLTMTGGGYLQLTLANLDPTPQNVPFESISFSVLSEPGSQPNLRRLTVINGTFVATLASFTVNGKVIGPSTVSIDPNITWTGIYDTNDQSLYLPLGGIVANDYTPNSCPMIFSLTEEGPIASMSITGSALEPWSSGQSANPQPEHMAVHVSLTPTLTWNPGDWVQNVNGNAVYFGLDFNAVNEANESNCMGVYMSRQDANSYNPGTLGAGATYYWRIDEYNDANVDSPWRGQVWSFTTNGPVDFCDLNNWPLGGAQLNVDSNGLTVSNIGSSGDDGVRVALPEHITSLHVNYIDVGDPNQFPVGAYIQATSRGTVNGEPNQIASMVHSVWTGSDVNTTVDFSALGPNSLTAEYYLDGKLVLTEVNISPVSPTWSCIRIPNSLEITLKIWIDRNFPFIHREPDIDWDYCSIPLPVVTTPEGNIVQVDKIAVYAKDIAVPFGGYTDMRITAAEISSITITKETITQCAVVLQGDLNGDCRVDIDDMKVLTQAWLRESPVADIYPQGNPDGIVNFGDFAVVAGNWLEYATDFERYKQECDNFEAALDSVVAWHSKAVELAHAIYDVPPEAIEEVAVKKITAVTMTDCVDFTIQTVKGENRTGDLIELRVKNYKGMDKVEAWFLYKGENQAYVKEEFTDDTLLRIEFENYENPDFNTIVEVTPHDITVSPWVFDVNVMQKGIVVTGTVTLEDTDPDLIHEIIDEIKPTGWVPIGALDPHMVGAILPEDAGVILCGWRDVVKGALCGIGTAALSAASNSGAGVTDVGIGAINLASIL